MSRRQGESRLTHGRRISVADWKRDFGWQTLRASGQDKFNALGLSSNPQYWTSTGKIVGIPDLLGAQMFVLLPTAIGSGDPEVDQYLPEIRRGFELQALIVSLSSGREFWFSGPALEKLVDNGGYPIYSFRFPKTLDELRKLERR
jgi:hypothetical protein